MASSLMRKSTTFAPLAACQTTGATPDPAVGGGAVYTCTAHVARHNHAW
eukprot:CAMPEP_0181235290 /NCGR_PEP_ID=MMETSP1096-20121128/37486_1 /TAXON_ID=156174 ORGANISM="Chrysochromulina ericina, Strain CCMP281" /NCGR_SAMPLE_ID=MMETSP1096 /ASSEMBLY_ACC=CAM_ASM_000453 /LENGTH=48 /DNA_ID= /DNA_START= /DNA_END= /DNA_ORIENTATION=